MDDLLAAEIGQAGTPFDGLSHIGNVRGSNADDLSYNQFTGTEMSGSLSVRAPGIEHVKPFFAAFHAHPELPTKNGIFIHENIANERLIEAGVSAFAFIYSPLPVVGATGSPGAPIAVY